MKPVTLTIPAERVEAVIDALACRAQGIQDAISYDRAVNPRHEISWALEMYGTQRFLLETIEVLRQAQKT